MDSWTVMDTFKATNIAPIGHQTGPVCKLGTTICWCNGKTSGDYSSHSACHTLGSVDSVRHLVSEVLSLVSLPPIVRIVRIV